MEESVKESSKNKRPGKTSFLRRVLEEKAEGRGTVLTTVSPPSWSCCCERCPFLSPGLLPSWSSWGAGTTCGRSCPSPISSSGDQVSLHQETKGEGTSWVPSPGSQASLHQGAKLPFTSRPCILVAWGGKPSISSLLPLFPCSGEQWQDLIQPCCRLMKLRPCCQSLCCCGLTDKLAAGIHELSRAFWHYSLKQLSSLKVAPQVAVSILKHQLRWPQNHVKCPYYPGNAASAPSCFNSARTCWNSLSHSQIKTVPLCQLSALEGY